MGSCGGWDGVAERVGGGDDVAERSSERGERVWSCRGVPWGERVRGWLP